MDLVLEPLYQYDFGEGLRPFWESGQGGKGSAWTKIGPFIVFQKNDFAWWSDQKVLFLMEGLTKYGGTRGGVLRSMGIGGEIQEKKKKMKKGFLNEESGGCGIFFHKKFLFDSSPGTRNTFLIKANQMPKRGENEIKERPDKSMNFHGPRGGPSWMAEKGSVQ